MTGALARLTDRRFGTLAGLLALGLTLSLLSPHFLTTSNLLNVFEQTAINAIIAVGMTFVIVSGGIDLSVGSLVALSGIVLALALQAGWPVPIAMAAGIATGAACGLVNGTLITLGRLPPFIATLGMMSVARGLALVLAEGRPISGFDGGFRVLATGSVAGLPMPAVVMIAAFVVGHVVLTRTRFGRYVFAAAVLTARLNSAQPIAGLMYELDAIAATVIGGTSLMGGEGSLGGTLVGALIMGVLRNGLNLLGVSSFVQQIVIGAVIIGAVLADTATRGRLRRR
jgi:ribose/xylose/arabinose/galactoside ABC-type transport system permease subunit